MGETGVMLLVGHQSVVDLLISISCLHLRVMCLEEYFDTVLKVNSKSPQCVQLSSLPL